MLRFEQYRHRNQRQVSATRFDINYRAWPRDPTSEIKTFVRQNNRIDNEVRDVKPNYISESKLSFVGNKALIFEGGKLKHQVLMFRLYPEQEHRS